MPTLTLYPAKLAMSTLLAMFTNILVIFIAGRYPVAMSYHHGNLRQSLIDAAMESLEEVGLEELSLRSLAESLGVSKAAPYRHFASKRDLLVALAAEGYSLFADYLENEEKRMSGLTGDDKIKEIYRIFGDFALNRPERYRLMFSKLGNSLHSERCRINAQRAFSVMVRLVRQLHPEAKDPLPHVLSLFASLHGWVMLLMDDLLPPDTGVDQRNWLNHIIPEEHN